MAGKIGKKHMKGSKNHRQQRGLRDRASYIDQAVDQAQTGVVSKRAKRGGKRGY